MGVELAAEVIDDALRGAALRIKRGDLIEDGDGVGIGAAGEGGSDGIRRLSNLSNIQDGGPPLLWSLPKS